MQIEESAEESIEENIENDRGEYRRIMEDSKLNHHPIYREDNTGDNSRKVLNGQETVQDCCCHQKSTPRSAEELKRLQNRLNRMVGQLNGIGRMLEENRYCGDILTQIAAVESALQAFGHQIFKEHMESCVVEEIQKGNLSVVDEAVELMKKLQ